MSTQTITSVAQHVVGQYNTANKHLVQAYCAGARRAIGSVGSAAARVESMIGERPLPLVNGEIKAGIVRAHQSVTGFLVNRLERGTERLVGAMDSVAERAASGIQSVAAVAARAESAFNIKASEPLRALNMPVAQFASQIADKVVEGARQIEIRVAGNAADQAVSTVAAKPARRAARKG